MRCWKVNLLVLHPCALSSTRSSTFRHCCVHDAIPFIYCFPCFLLLLLFLHFHLHAASVCKRELRLLLVRVFEQPS